MPKKQQKRPNGDGSIYQTKSGQWQVSITVRLLDGSSKRVKRNAKSHRHGMMILDELKTEFRNLADNPSTITVAELFEKWLSDFEGEKSTRDQYKLLLNLHIAPHIGQRLVGSLSPLEVQSWVQTLRTLETGARTLQMAYTLVKRVCQWGVDIRLLPHNPCNGIRRPAAKREAILPFTKAEVDSILSGTKSHRLHALFVLAVTTGMRQGELFGLQWSDIDLNRRLVSISRQAKDYRGSVTLKTPKTAAGVRTISITEKASIALSARRELAETEGNGSNPQVFCSPRGMLIRRTLFGKRTWKPLLETLGIQHRGAHHLRHTAATMMLGAGVPPHIVAGVLGHETAETVMKTYAHFINKDSSVAADVMSKLFELKEGNTT